MTEYDFSPEAYHRHLHNMHGISKWVDQTEQHRSQFENAAALTAHSKKEHRSRLGKRRSSKRPASLPLPLPLPPQGYGMMYAPQYPVSPYSGSSSQRHGYSSAPNSPGPMPSSLYHQPQQQFVSPAPSYGYGIPLPYSPYGYMQGYTASPPHSQTHVSPYVLPPPPPLPFGPFPGMGGGGMMSPGYIVLPQSSGRRGSHRRRSMSYVYV